MRDFTDWFRVRRVDAVALGCAALVTIAVAASCSRREAPPQGRTFAAPEEAVQGLVAAVKTGDLPAVAAIFGPGGQELIDTSDPITARSNREVFTVAMNQGWRLVDEADHKMLIVGDEGWPFPVPLVKAGNGWRFDIEAGKEEILARRIGRNELSAIQVCRTFVAAQRLYAQRGHDGKPAGLFAQVFSSDPGRQNGLYWPAAHGQTRSPLGELMTSAAEDRQRQVAAHRPGTPFHGYFFRILSGQGSSAPGGARDYIVDGNMSGGFALVAWPATYDVTGVMTFIVNHDGDVFEKDLGAGTDTAVTGMTRYDPDASWSPAQ